MSKQVHYAIKRDEAGKPVCLYWSPEIQAAGEARVQQEKALKAKQALPMASYIEWATERGLINPEKQ